MTKKQVVLEALQFRPPPYVPWTWGMTTDCLERFRPHLRGGTIEEFLDPHFLDFGAPVARAETVRAGYVRDPYGVVWDRTVDKDIGTPCDWPIRKPEDLARYEWPDANDDRWYQDIPARLAAHGNLFNRYCIGFALYERAWTMRGMSDLLMDMVERPEFVEELLDAIVEHDLIQVHRAIRCGVDAVYFGDDYGMQTGLIFGIDHWRHFIKPRLARMFEPVRAAGKFVCMHSCGKVESLFDDLIEIGLNLFNPFQPEVMDVFSLMKACHGRLAFHGGMSVQKVLPFGTPREVREATGKLLSAGAAGGYVFSPSHGVPRDVPPENLLAMAEVLKSQAGYRP